MFLFCIILDCHHVNTGPLMRPVYISFISSIKEPCRYRGPSHRAVERLPPGYLRSARQDRAARGPQDKRQRVCYGREIMPCRTTSSTSSLGVSTPSCCVTNRSTTAPAAWTPSWRRSTAIRSARKLSITTSRTTWTSPSRPPTWSA